MPRVALCEVGRYNINMFYVYILKLNNGEHYIGFSDDLKQRILDHQAGKCVTTQKFRPIELLWYSAFKNKYKALQFEKYLKQSSGFAFRNKHLI